MIFRLRSFLILLLTGCAVNPATGRRELSLVGEDREIAMGREADIQITASLGLAGGPELQRYVSDLGDRLAVVSERPQLPWSFKVVDDPAVNAFALPGGFIYLTRGILAHFESEAELAGVLGHEIGHVTARHSVSQMSRQQIFSVGLGLGALVSERIRSTGDYLGAGLQLWGLKFSRDDESESDALGLRYISRLGYDPESLVGVFRMLAAVSGGSEGRVPQWQLTHPYPENREADIRALIAAGDGGGGEEVGRDTYLDRIDGLLYGENPREGFFQGSRLVHPALAFEADFPPGWTGVNQRSLVAAVSPDERAVVVLRLSDAEDPGAGLRAFLGQEGIAGGRIREDRESGIERRRATFEADGDEGGVQGEVAFLAMDGQVFSFLGYASSGEWRNHEDAVGRAISSFARVTDRELLDIQPWTLKVVTLGEAMSLRVYHEREGVPVPVEELARLNRVRADDVLPSGTRVKGVVGAPLPGP